jgi:hypothetical protein
MIYELHIERFWLLCIHLERNKEKPTKVLLTNEASFVPRKSTKANSVLMKIKCN